MYATEEYIIRKQNTHKNHVSRIFLAKHPNFLFWFHREVHDMKSVSFHTLSQRGLEAEPSLSHLGQDVITSINLNHLERLRINSKKVPL